MFRRQRQDLKGRKCRLWPSDSLTKVGLQGYKVSTHSLQLLLPNFLPDRFVQSLRTTSIILFLLITGVEVILLFLLTKHSFSKCLLHPCLAGGIFCPCLPVNRQLSIKHGYTVELRNFRVSWN